MNYVSFFIYDFDSTFLSKIPLGVNPNRLRLGYTDALALFFLEFAGKIWHTCLAFRGRVPYHRSAVSPTRFETEPESQKAIGNENLQVQVVFQSRQS